MTNDQSFVLVGPAPPYRGGIAQFTESLGAALSARGHRVSAVTFTRQYPALFFPGETQYAPAGEAERSALPVARLIDSVDPRSWWQAAQHVARQQPDAVIFQHWMPFFAPAFGAMARVLRWRGIRPLALVHNALPHERRPGDRLLSRALVPACDGFVVMSEAVEQDLRALGATTPIRRAPHPVYARFGTAPPKAEARAALGLPAGAPVILFFGLVRKYKGLHTLLEAMPMVAEHLPEAHLVVAGEFYDDERPYRDQIRARGLEDRVHIRAEFIPDAEVPRLFAAADLVAQPYVTATQSGVAQVAFHFERPLVVTDIGGLAEIVPHEQAGLVVPPEDPHALAAAITRFFQEDGLAERLAGGVRRQKAAHSWDRVCEAVEDLAAPDHR